LVRPAVTEVVTFVDDGVLYGMTFPQGTSAPASGTVAIDLRTIFDLKSPNADLKPPSSPGLTDIDGDGSDEIFVGTLDGRFYVLKANGESFLGSVGGVATPLIVLPTEDEDGDLPPELREIQTSPALGRVNAGDDIDVVFAGGNGRLYGFEIKANGGFASLWNTGGQPGLADPSPIFPMFRRSSPLIGPLKRQGGNTVLICGTNGRIYAVDETSLSLLTLAPKEAAVKEIVTTATLADVNADGRNDLVYAANTTDNLGFVNVLASDKYSGGEPDWETFRHDFGRTGRLDLSEIVSGLDFNGDGRIDFVDLFLLSITWGEVPPASFGGKIDQSRAINAETLLRLIEGLRKE
jgi:hypothetical protein